MRREPGWASTAVWLVLLAFAFACGVLVVGQAFDTRVLALTGRSLRLSADYSADPRLAFIGKQFGMFSMLPLSRDQVLKLRTDHAIYMADSGRFNIVGLSDDQVERFTAAVVDALDA